MAELNLGHVVGPGVPTGGTSGQILKKNSATNFDTSWSANDATTIPMSSSDSTSINQAISKLNSNANSTNDILADAVNCTETKLFNGSGGSYTGIVPDMNYKWATFIVNVKGTIKTVIAHAPQNMIAINSYDNGTWLGWQQLALKSDIANETGSCTSSYGTIEYVKTGNVVQLTIACTGIASNAWETISSNVPKAKKNCAFVGADQSAGGNVALSITGTSLAFYGRGQYTTCNCSILYIAE